MKKLLNTIMLSFISSSKPYDLNMNESSTEQMVQILVSLFKESKDEKLLLILDNVEDLIYYDKKHFRELIRSILE